MKELSMTPNAVKKRREKEDPIRHLRRQGDKNITLCNRIIFDVTMLIVKERPTCKLCIRQLRN